MTEQGNTSRSAFIYYVPAGTDLSTAEGMRAVGLPEYISPGNTNQKQVGKGPGESGPGWIITKGAPEAFRLDFSGEGQSWVSLGEKGAYVGLWEENRPTPNDLRRVETIGGHTVPLADDNKWLIPVVRAFPEGSALPQAIGIGPSGEMVYSIIPKYKRFSDKSLDLMSWYDDLAVVAAAFKESRDKEAFNEGMKEIENKYPELTDRYIFEVCCEALSINYRVSVPEVSLLGIITTHNQNRIIEALLDIPSVKKFIDELEAKKKKEVSTAQDTTPISDGSLV